LDPEVMSSRLPLSEREDRDEEKAGATVHAGS
jgi:hypothetical protein